MSTPYDDEFIDCALAGSCPHCGRALEDGASVLDEPLFDGHSPAGHFFCGYCGAPLIESI